MIIKILNAGPYKIIKKNSNKRARTMIFCISQNFTKLTLSHAEFILTFVRDSLEHSIDSSASDL